jgi:hypothetical protein
MTGGRDKEQERTREFSIAEKDLKHHLTGGRDKEQERTREFSIAEKDLKHHHRRRHQHLTEKYLNIK